MNGSAFKKLENLYAALAEEISGLDVQCTACGFCCDFPKAGHILYASRIEVEYFVHEVRRLGLQPVDNGSELCSFQSVAEKACLAHSSRVLGCRLHYCRSKSCDKLSEKSSLALEEISERYHRRLQEIHKEEGLQWEYRPFLVALDEGYL